MFEKGEAIAWATGMSNSVTARVHLKTNARDARAGKDTASMRCKSKVGCVMHAGLIIETEEEILVSGVAN